MRIRVGVGNSAGGRSEGKTMKPEVHMADQLGKDNPLVTDGFHRKLLAEGDSWYTIGALSVKKAPNLLHNLEVQHSTLIVNCAYPGHALKRMVDWSRDQYFVRLLSTPGFQKPWDGIILSAGGNDLIDAARVLPKNKKGLPIPAEERLFLTSAEIQANGGGNTPDRFLSKPGWETFKTYLLANFDALIKSRDGGVNKGKPIILHTYATPIVRPSGTFLNKEGWLYPALKNYGIVGADAQAVSDLIFGKLRQLLLDLEHGGAHALPQVHVFDSAGVPGIVAANPNKRGSSGDWINEIHLTPGGYAKVGAKMGPWLDGILN